MTPKLTTLKAMTAVLALALLATFTAPAERAEAQTLEQIKETKTVRLGVRRDAAPFSSIIEGERTAGYSVDLCIAVAGQISQMLGVGSLSVEFVEVTAENRFDSIVEGKIDLLCGATSVTLSRREVIDFSTPIFVDGASVLLRADGPQSFAELEGKVIGVRGGTTTETALENTLIRQQVTATVMAVTDHADGLAALESKQIDAYFADQSILFFLTTKSQEPTRLMVSENSFTVELYALGLPRGDNEFRLAVDRALARLFRGGAVKSLFEKNFGNAQPSEGLRYLARFGALPE